MAIESVSSSAATQALRPQQSSNGVQEAAQKERNGNGSVGNLDKPEPPKPTVNTRGETVGTRINVSA